MNRIYYWIVTLLLLLCVGCRKGDSSYQITGVVVHPNADGNMIYLSHSNGDELVNLDSAIIDGGRFTFRGVQEVPIMAYLRFKNPYDSLARPALFILENGSLTARMDTLYSSVTGTPQNAEFDLYRREVHRLDSLRERQYNDYRAQVEAGTMTARTEQAMCETYRGWEREQVRLAYDFIEKNNESPASLWLLETMQGQFSEDELQELISKFSGIGKMGKRPPVVEKITQQLRNASKLESGNAYVDIELLNNRDRNRKLSNYVGYNRYTVVGFWRSDSKPACRDMIRFTRLQQEFSARGAGFLGISLDESQEVWKQQVADLKLTTSSQCRASQVDDVIERYALAAVPSFMVIAPNGTIHSRNLSMIELVALLQNLVPQQESNEEKPAKTSDTSRTE